MNIVLTPRVIRFVLVGMANTALHFAVLNISFSLWHFDKLSSSLLATACAVTVSFILNRKIVFNANTSHLLKQAVLFVTVTLIGMVLIHNVIFILVLKLITPFELNIANLLQLLHVKLSYDTFGINIATLAGASVAIVWNYFSYKNFVFRPVDDGNE